MPTLLFTTNLLPLSAIIGGRLPERERLFKEEVRTALTTAGVPVREVFSMATGFRFGAHPLPGGGTENIQFFTVDLGVEIDPGLDSEALEYICDKLSLPSFPVSAWKFSEN